MDIRADVSPELLDRIRVLGGEVDSHFAEFRAIRARLPLEEIEALAGMPEVDFIRPADRAITRAIDVSEGDVAHRADLARGFFWVDGAGVAVGVLSDGVDSLTALQASGDLPPTVTVLPGQAGSGSEGTAMLEIVHDLAPGADLLFATAFGGQASFASNILALRSAGADVIVDDVGYFAEAVFQDDDVADSVDAVVADGALYFSSAGNSGNLNDGTSGVWEGDFAFTGTTFNGDPAHDFGGGIIANQITVDSPFVFTLQWSDAQGASGNDYDLFLVDPDGTTLLAASTNIQNGNDDPFEIIDSGSLNDTGNRLIIVKSSGDDRFLHLNANRGRLAIATQGQTSGHSAAAGAVSVAAVDDLDAGGIGGVFDGSESVETFSSDGPRRIFYQADGTPITPGDFSSTGGTLRQKPDVTAADCVSTATPGFGVFCGTSAAAPHAAAIAALLIELGSGTGLTATQIRDALGNTALDIEAAGVDRDSGSGIVDAFEAATAVDLSELRGRGRQRRRRRHRLPGRPGLRLRQRSVGAVGSSPLRRRPRQRQRRKDRFRSGDLRQSRRREHPPGRLGGSRLQGALLVDREPPVPGRLAQRRRREDGLRRGLSASNGRPLIPPGRIPSASASPGETTRDNRRPAAWASSWYFSCRR